MVASMRMMRRMASLWWERRMVFATELKGRELGKGSQEK